MIVRYVYNKLKKIPDKLLGDLFNHEFEPLHSAAAHGNLEEIRLLLDKGRPVDEISKAYLKKFIGTQNCTPLYLAAQEGQLDAVKLLLNKGANVGKHCWNDATPLHAAISRSHIEVVEHLLLHGAPLEAQDKAGRTPLHYAAGWKDEGIMELLIKYNANVKALDKAGASALHISVNKSFAYNALEVQTNRVLEALQQNWLSNLLYLCFKFLWLALGWLSRLHDWIIQNPNRLKYHRSIQSKVLCCVRLLLEHGADLDLQQKDGRTPLHIAAGFETVYVDVVEMLLDQGAQLEIRDEDGQTPLHEAAQAGFTQAVSLLIRRGAQVDARDTARWTPLHFAAKYGHVTTAVALLQAGADVDKQTMKGSTPLHLACDLTRVGHVTMVPLLLEHGASPNLTNQKHETVLHVALRGRLNGVPHGHQQLLNVMDLLLERSADINSPTKAGITLLHEACAAGSPELVRALLNRGARLNVVDERGRTPLHEAARSGSHNVVQLLLDAGADFFIKDYDGRTPRDWLLNYSWLHQLRYAAMEAVSGLDSMNLGGDKADFEQDVWT